jgi:Flp pilus assembly protein TadD
VRKEKNAEDMLRVKRMKSLMLFFTLFLVSCGTESAMTDEVVKADTELKDGAPQAALEVLKHYLNEHPDDPRALTELGKVNASMGRNQAAAIFFEQALQHKPNFLEASKGLAKIRLMEDPSQATVLFLDMVKRYPRDVQAWIDLGVSYDLQGNYKAAEAAYRKGMSLDPMKVSTQCNLGLSLALSGQHVQALEILEPLAVAPDTTSSKVRANFALAQYLAGYKDNARNTLMHDMSGTQADAVMASFSKFETQPYVAQ